jgi:hypothetical protein
MLKKFPYRFLLFLGLCSFVLLTSAYVLNHSKTPELNALILDHAEEQLPLRTNTAFKEGEELKYRLHYGFINAGEAVLEVKPQLQDLGGRKVYHIVGRAYTTGSTDWLFKVRDQYETYLDRDALLPWWFVRRVEEGGFKFSQDYVFDHYTNKVDIGNNQKFDVPTGVQDMVSAFYAARNLDLSKAKEGDVFSLSCFMDKEVWPLRIRFIRREVLETNLGKFRTLVFRPVVQKGRVFKQDEDLTVWISDDRNRVPLCAEAKILVGSIKMEISAYKNLGHALNRVN